MKKNIVLIGMPGVGKSTIGVIIAKILGYQFIDADLVIQEQYGKLLKEIIAERGTDGFVQVENDVNKSLNPESNFHRRKRCLLHRGNGTFIRNSNNSLFKIRPILFREKIRKS